MKEVFGNIRSFEYPKPISLIERILYMVGDKDALVMDSFAGSATTGAAILNMNREDGGARRFILVEMERDIAEKVAAVRLKRVISGYSNDAIKNTVVEGTGGGVRYCRLGTSIFNEFGDIDTRVSFPDLAAHIFFSETGVPIPARVEDGTVYIGKHGGKAVYLLFASGRQDGVDEAADNVLTPDTLASLPAPPGEFEGVRVVYAEGCTVSSDRLQAKSVVFKQIPYQIAES